MSLKATDPLTLDEIIEEFDFLGDWESRCDYLIDLGMELPNLPDSEKTEPNRVHGCQSMVWMIAEVQNNGEPRVLIRADSDAMIVRGLIAVLLATYSGKTPQEIIATDAKEVFTRLELDRYLSSARKNGLFGMVQRIRELAVTAAA